MLVGHYLLGSIHTAMTSLHLVGAVLSNASSVDDSAQCFRSRLSPHGAFSPMPSASFCSFTSSFLVGGGGRAPHSSTFEVNLSLFPSDSEVFILRLSGSGQGVGLLRKARNRVGVVQSKKSNLASSKMTLICLMSDNTNLICLYSSELEMLLQKNSPHGAGHVEIFSISPSESPEDVFPSNDISF